jgi:hypothetical protein
VIVGRRNLSSNKSWYTIIGFPAAIYNMDIPHMYDNAQREAFVSLHYNG